MSHGKQFTLYTHVGGPNGWYVYFSRLTNNNTHPHLPNPRKVAMVLEELGLTYEPIYLDFAKKQHKAPEFTQLNPNGRIPALVDHRNGDFVVWESGAILLYLVDKYDPEHTLSVADDKEKHAMVQWLFFQASGQGCVPPLSPSSTHADAPTARTSAKPSGS